MYVNAHSSLEGTQSSRFDIRRLIGQPQTCCYMHDEAERISIFNLCHPHALNVPLGALLQLLLCKFRREWRKPSCEITIKCIKHNKQIKSNSHITLLHMRLMVQTITVWGADLLHDFIGVIFRKNTIETVSNFYSSFVALGRISTTKSLKS